MTGKVTEWPSNCGPISKTWPSDRCKGIQFPWRWDSGTISTQLDVIWGMSAKMPERDKKKPRARGSV